MAAELNSQRKRPSVIRKVSGEECVRDWDTLGGREVVDSAQPDRERSLRKVGTGERTGLIEHDQDASAIHTRRSLRAVGIAAQKIEVGDLELSPASIDFVDASVPTGGKAYREAGADQRSARLDGHDGSGERQPADDDGEDQRRGCLD
ncbi:MAG: hypothetical protein ACYC9Z_18580 [Casimicrobiaceae bacterium]